MTDIITSLQHIAACRRCACRSCSNGEENHSHYCTHGEHCINTEKNLLHFVFTAQHVANQARVEIRDLRAQLAAALIDNCKGEGI